ncbi:MAG: PH domain-containing protein [Actinomycetota bacterium]|nr:PH domain-containing protein [Actinomycetota bacterium]
MTSDGPGAGSLTYRPLGARVVALVGGGCLGVVTLVMWFAFPKPIRDGFKAIEVVTLLFFLFAALVVLYGIARARVTSDAEGLRVLNCFREHRVAWDRVADICLSTGMPWAIVHTTDGAKVAVIAVQGADGDRARAQVRLLRRRLAESRQDRTDHR